MMTLIPQRYYTDAKIDLHIGAFFCLSLWRYIRAHPSEDTSATIHIYCSFPTRLYPCSDGVEISTLFPNLLSRYLVIGNH